MMPADLSRYTEPLLKTPSVLRAVIDGRPDSWLDSKHAEDVFSPRIAVAHLVVCERETFVSRIRHVWKPETAVFTPEEESIQFVKSHTLSELLDIFEELRPKCVQELLDLNLEEPDLACEADDDELGVISVRSLLACWVTHDLYHLGQIFKSYASQFKDEIGPWQTFLNLPDFN